MAGLNKCKTQSTKETENYNNLKPKRENTLRPRKQ